MSTRKVFPCNTCDLVFEISQAQRTHMREPWHVYNLKRRMADLPPISAEDYTDKVATSLVSNKSESLNQKSPSTAVSITHGDDSAEENGKSERSIEKPSQINCCLFCTEESGSLEANISHMSMEHGLFLPEIEHLSSLESMIGYLSIIINEYNECLYCGITKQSSAGIRRHMRDKGHCMIDLEREPELLEFWEFSDSDGQISEDEAAPLPRAEQTHTPRTKDLSQGEYILPSGKIVGSKNKAREARLLTRRLASSNKDTHASCSTKTKDLVGTTDVIPSPKAAAGSLIEDQARTQNRAINKRDAVGLIGVPDQQIRSLVSLERKTQRQQAVVQASASWAGDKGGIHQRHYKTKMNLRDG